MAPGSREASLVDPLVADLREGPKVLRQVGQQAHLGREAEEVRRLGRAGRPRLALSLDGCV